MLQTNALPASAGLENPERPFGFADLLRLLRQRGKVVRNVTAGVVGLTAIALLIWPSRYSTTAVVMLDPRKNNITDSSQVLTELPTDPASVQDQIQILTSRDLAAQVIDRLRLANDSEFNSALASSLLNMFEKGLGADAQRSTIIDSFLRHLSVGAEGLSTAVSVTFASEDRKSVV